MSLSLLGLINILYRLKKKQFALLSMQRANRRVRTGYGILEKLWNFEKEIPYMEKLWNLSKTAVPMEKLWNFVLVEKSACFL